MDENSEDVVLEVQAFEPEPQIHQIAKLVIGAVAGFFVSKAIGIIYDAAREQLTNKDDDFEYIEITDEV